MEKALSSEERIRRAEEIYTRRRMQNDTRVSTARINTKINGNNKLKLYKKLILQILTCFFIYFVFYLVRNSNFVFSESFINKTKEFLSYDINFNDWYDNIDVFYNEKVKTYFEKINNKDLSHVNEITNEIYDESINEDTKKITNEQTVDETTKNEGIGGGEDENIKVEEDATKTSEEAEIQLSQMEIDANNIKENHSFILPLAGVISSRYGAQSV